MRLEVRGVWDDGLSTFRDQAFNRVDVIDMAGEQDLVIIRHREEPSVEHPMHCPR